MFTKGATLSGRVVFPNRSEQWGLTMMTEVFQDLCRTSKGGTYDRLGG
ncbi:MAG: hypothetical protein NZ578_02030 [Candidatus Binatia bacterium]|nr:hypothetical protein [Candidatus Binatia bacterium]